jgi:hypothetical protein
MLYLKNWTFEWLKKINNTFNFILRRILIKVHSDIIQILQFSIFDKSQYILSDFKLSTNQISEF